MQISVLLSAMMIAAISSCTTSVITNSWKSAEYQTRKYNKILVIALVNDKERLLRINMESHLADDIKNKNVFSISSLQEYGPRSFEGMSEKQVIDTLAHSGIDGVLTIVLLDKSKERYYVPGRVYYTPYSIYHRRFWGYYSTIYERIYEPGYYTENTEYFWETNFYDLEKRELVYSAQTKSFNPSDAETLGHEYGKLICEDMAKSDIFK